MSDGWESAVRAVEENERYLWEAPTGVERNGATVCVSFQSYARAARALGHGRPWRVARAIGAQRLEVLCHRDIVGFWEDEAAPAVRFGSPVPLDGISTVLDGAPAPACAHLEKRVMALETRMAEVLRQLGGQ